MPLTPGSLEAEIDSLDSPMLEADRRVADAAGGELDPDHSSDLVASIDALLCGIGARQARLLELIAEFDNSGRFSADGCRDAAQWLAGRAGMSQWAARRWVGAAHAVTELPAIAGALEAGTLGVDKVLELARFATAKTERKLVGWARRVSVAAIRRCADRARTEPLDEIKDADRARYLRWWYFDDGHRMGLEGEFPAAQGAAIAAALKRTAETLPEVPPDDDGEGDGIDARRADALAALASVAIAEDSCPDRATVVVHTALGTIGGTGPYREIADGPVLHPDIGRRLACDCRLQFVLTDATGDALGIGRTARNVPLWLERIVRQRDGGCTFPGCGTKAWLQMHHIWHWELGGPTELNNLVSVCCFHHKLVHEFGWRVALRGAVVRWFRPDGRSYMPGPDPPRAIVSVPTKLEDRYCGAFGK